jgi:signal peptidase II
VSTSVESICANPAGGGPLRRANAVPRMSTSAPTGSPDASRFGQNFPNIWREILLTHIPTLVLIAGVLLLLAFRRVPTLDWIGYGFLIGGGTGNLIDRHLTGSVTDFLNVGMGPIRTGIFNMADVSILVGIGLLIFKEAIRRAWSGIRWREAKT